MSQVDESTKMRPCTGRIMIVDDEVDLLVLLQKALERAGYTVATSNSAGRTLQTMAAFQPDVLITDVMMPKMNGFQLLEAVRREYPNLPVVLISGRTRAESLGIAQVLEVFAILEKPFCMQALQDTCRRAAEKSLLQRSLKETGNQLIRRLSDLTDSTDSRDILSLQKTISRDLQNFIDKRSHLRRLDDEIE